MYISDYMQTTTFFYLGKFVKKLAEDKLCSSITEDRMYHKINVHVPFTIVADWPEIVCLMEVSIMFDSVFLLCTADISTLPMR